jgi:hypothetical protein
MDVPADRSRAGGFQVIGVSVVSRPAASAAAPAASETGQLSVRELLLVGVALYWAEGTKDKPYARRELVKFINSDVTVIRLFVAWLRLLGVNAEGCGYRVHIHETADAKAAVEYWAGVVDVDPSAFSKTVIKRHNPKTNRRNREHDYHGCLVVTVRRSAELYQRIDGWWHGMCSGVTAFGSD